MLFCFKFAKAAGKNQEAFRNYGTDSNLLLKMLDVAKLSLLISHE